MKILLWFIATFTTVFLLITGVASAQVSGSLWKLSANYLYPVNSSWGLAIPALANNNCIGTDSSGKFQAGTCTGSSFPFTPHTYGNSTSTTIVFTQGIITNASTTFSQLSTGAMYDQNGLVLAHATTSSSVASQDVWRDANQNAFAQNFVSAATTFPSLGTTATLTAASPRTWVVTGTNVQTFKLPVGTTLTQGATYTFNNNSTGLVTIVDNGSNVLTYVLPGGSRTVVLYDNSTSNGGWDSHGYLGHKAYSGYNSLSLGSTTPFAELVVHTNPTDTVPYTTLFAISSSTAAATTTLFSVDNVGTTTLGRFGTCSGTNALTTDSSGHIICGAITGSGGTGTVSTSSSETATYVPFWTSTNATPALLSGGVAAFQFSSTDSRLTVTNSSSTAVTISSALYPSYLTSGQVPYVGGTNQKLVSVATSTPTFSSPLTTSGTAGYLIGGSAFTIGCQTASGAQAGCLSSADWTTFNNKLGSYDAWTHPLATQSATTSTVIFSTGATSTLFTTTGATWLANSGGSNVAIGATSTPYGLLSIDAPATTNPYFVIGSSTSEVLKVIPSASPFFGIGTTSPGTILSIGNTTGINFTTATSTFNSTGGIELKGGCFKVNGACLTPGGSGTVTSVNAGSTGSTLTFTGGPITTSGTINGEINLAHSNAWTALQTFSNASTSLLSVTGTGYFGGTATSTVDSTGKFTFVTAPVFSTLTGVLIGNGASVATAGSTQTCTNQFVRAMSSLYAATCATVSLTADVTGTLPIANGGTNATSFTTSNNSVYYDGTRLVTSGTSQAVTTPYASSTASTISSELNIPHSGTVPTLYAGDLYTNTNSTASSSIAFSDGTNAHSLFAVHTMSFVVASSTLAYDGAFGASGSTTLAIANPLHASTLQSFFCKTDVGTAWVGFGTGAATTTQVQCTSTGAGTTLSTNNTWNGRKTVYVEIGHSASSPNNITISADVEDKN